MGRAVVRHGFVPGLVAACVAALVYREEGQAFLTARAVRLDYLSAVVLGLIASVAVVERLVPARVDWNAHPARAGGVFRDLFYLFVVTQLSGVLIHLVSTRLTPALGSLGFGFGVSWAWPSAASFALKVALAFFSVELASYWLHRAAHRVPLLWQFHSTHHGITQLNGVKALRTHPVENVLFYAARNVPLMLLGAGADEVLVATTLGALLGILAHANLEVSERGVGWLINLPGYHAVHHSAVRAESDSNYGCHTILWDRVFGTFRPAAVAPLEVGVTPVGTRTVWQELVWPFYRWVGAQR